MNALSIIARRAAAWLKPPEAHDPMQPVLPTWRPIRGPLERWPHLTDSLIALVAFGLNLIMWSHDNELTLGSLLEVGSYLCVFVGSFALLWRRSHPWQVHAVILSLSILVFVAAPVDGIVAMVFSLYSLGRYEADHRASIAGVLAAFSFVVLDLLIVNEPSAGSTFAALMVLALWYMGRRLRFRGEYLRLLEERAQYLERERTAQSERAVVAERTRIAREMHDIVAHQLSLMTVQAGAARTVAGSDPQAAGEAMASVEAAGRQALSEMRHLLGVLRPSDAAGALEPQPGVADLPNVVRQVQEVGLKVQFQSQGDLTGVAAGLELAIYRIVQESLTNVIKHAGTQANVMVKIDGGHRDIVVTIKDDGSGCSADLNGGHTGHGVAGMRERVQLLGGSLHAGNSVATGFEVRAVIPRNRQAGTDNVE